MFQEGSWGTDSSLFDVATQCCKFLNPSWQSKRFENYQTHAYWMNFIELVKSLDLETLGRSRAFWGLKVNLKLPKCILFIKHWKLVVTIPVKKKSATRGRSVFEYKPTFEISKAFISFLQKSHDPARLSVLRPSYSRYSTFSRCLSLQIRNFDIQALFEVGVLNFSSNFQCLFKNS